jgi:diguanylate cyclase (GGDEF)-like protein
VSVPAGRLLSWERELLRTDSLDEWLAHLAAPPGGATGALLLADATHELRPLLAGSRDAGPGAPRVSFVTSLAGLAPQVLEMRGVWRGEYHAADHELLFPGGSALRHLVVLPLCRGDHTVGLYTAATTAGPPPFDGVDAALLDHAADVIAATLDRHLERGRVLRGGLVDPLTGWNSARYLQARLREEVARAQRTRGSVACLVVDVDRLQALNEELGHGAGDRALQELAARIDSEVRASDAAGRLGSDAFAIVLPDTDAARAARLAERMLAAVRSAPVDLGGGDRRDLRVSIGIAECRPAPGEQAKNDADQLVADAVAALHRAKRAGGDCHVTGPT